MDDYTDEFDDIDIGVLLADPGADSEVFARWSERLGQYVQGQGSLDALRLWLFRGSDPFALRDEGELAVEGSDSAFRALTTAFLPREKSSEQVCALGAAQSATPTTTELG